MMSCSRGSVAMTLISWFVALHAVSSIADDKTVPRTTPSTTPVVSKPLAATPAAATEPAEMETHHRIVMKASNNGYYVHHRTYYVYIIGVEGNDLVVSPLCFEHSSGPRLNVLNRIPYLSRLFKNTSGIHQYQLEPGDIRLPLQEIYSMKPCAAEDLPPMEEPPLFQILKPGLAD